MEQQPRKKKTPSCLDQFNRGDGLNGSLEAPEREKSRLKELAVWLSQTIIRLVTRNKKHTDDLTDQNAQKAIE
jgi:hypothetical protein